MDVAGRVSASAPLSIRRESRRLVERLDPPFVVEWLCRLLARGAVCAASLSFYYSESGAGVRIKRVTNW